MCGINGFIELNTASKDYVALINSMNDLIIHRGPDDDGIYIHKNSDQVIGMGMRRLSIIDLHTGSQPIHSDDHNCTIVFNGEIYNFLELRHQLKEVGISFNTTSDTEVILKLYEYYGEDSFKLLDGMFAFSIHDKKKNKIFIARDFFGEKPLYYTKTAEGLIWSSELKSLVKVLPEKPAISKTGLELFFRLTYIPAPFTIYQQINKLESNHYICFDLNSNSLEVRPISHPPRILKNDISFKDAKLKTRELVYDSVISRSVSDVPIGTFLSGGVDSSIVSLCLSKYKSTPIDTFSIGFEKKSYDETDKSQTVAKLIGSHHHEFIINEQDLQEDVHRILLNFDEPFADSSSLPTFMVSKKTSDYVKVALTGDGGDELFGGYNKYYMGKLNKRYTQIIPEKIHDRLLSATAPLLNDKDDSRGIKYKMKRLLNSVDYSDAFYWEIISLGYTANTIHQYLKPSYLSEELFEQFKTHSGIQKPTTLTDYRIIDKHVSLEGDMLVKVDRTSMLNSLECRAPFLNKTLWEYTHSLPESFLMKGWNKKYILKEAFKDDFPKGFLDKSKSGFGVPVGDWLRKSLKNELLSYVEDSQLNTQNIFNTRAIQELVHDHVDSKADNTFKVWTFYCFQKWYYNTYLKL
ncbi:asparagine synthase (glutamine-hydrolyzing) [Zhouia amylolytica]|uniref:asparagine synthase (glutamine-hydrolyzing) n=1 Tax=Zhouia amylolytica AD3 TaxID=1286632 RepID=W2UQD7_9FLAO|nr:asparagine synthase (glutamine-hydrolyzing) [Zhouia amylolytica]ETN96213.1 asparagine synthase (glutamine-hydrolyzing) [Zhouia amylolytica AD3]